MPPLVPADMEARLAARYFLRLSLRSPQLSPFSSTAAEHSSPQTQDSQNTFMADYLVRSCGLSKKAALSAPARLACIKSAEKPDSVLKFLKDSGLSGTQIADLIARRPLLLASNVEKGLRPKFALFNQLGVSGPEMADLLRRIDFSWYSLDGRLAPRINFLRSLVRNDDAAVRKMLKRCLYLLTATDNVYGRVLANVACLRDWGFSDDKIKAIISSRPRLVMLRPEVLPATMNRVEWEFGIPRSSGMFVYAVIVMCAKNSSVPTKCEIFRSYGWSDSEIFSLFKSQPFCFSLSETKLVKGLEFLMKEAGVSASYIANYPVLLMLSLEKRVCPRYEVLSVLQSKNLLPANLSFWSVMKYTENEFVKKFIMKYKQVAPDVCENYSGRMGMAIQTT